MSASRSQQLEYFLQGSIEESSLSSLRHRLKGLCDPSTTHNKFADHEIVYGLRPRKFIYVNFFHHVCTYLSDWLVEIVNFVQTNATVCLPLPPTFGRSDGY